MSTETPAIKPITPEELEEITRSAAEVVEVFGDNWDLKYDDDMGEVVCQFEDEDAPWVGALIQVFTTTQWIDSKDRSPVAEFLRASIVTVPRLVGEVERLQAALAAAQSQTGGAA